VGVRGVVGENSGLTSGGGVSLCGITVGDVDDVSAVVVAHDFIHLIHPAELQSEQTSLCLYKNSPYGVMIFGRTCAVSILLTGTHLSQYLFMCSCLAGQEPKKPCVVTGFIIKKHPIFERQLKQAGLEVVLIKSMLLYMGKMISHESFFYFPAV
jgi:hypothetical protein